MRKKRNNELNVSHLFVLKHASGPKLFQKNQSSTSSFSQAVSGFKVNDDGYKKSWPELKSDLKFTSYRDPKESTKETSTSQQRNKNVLSNSSNDLVINTESNNLRSDNDNSFPCLSGKSSWNRVQKDPKQSSTHFIQPSKSYEDEVFKTRTSSKGIKPKRNDPIKIDIGSAIELSLSKKKKELKRLNPRRPLSLKPPSCSGNALDSANPVRKKGKVRLNKKKKLTALKKTINKIRNLQTENAIQVALCKYFDGLSLSQEHLDKLAKAKIHTSKFREYCNNFASPELVTTVKDMLHLLRSFQDRSYKKDEIKAKAKRRFAIGFHECWKLLMADSLKLLILATNIERNEALLNKISEFQTEAHRRGVPLVFAGLVLDLSYSLYKKNRVSIVGIINYDGANDLYDKLMLTFLKDKAQYELEMSQIIENEKNAMATDDVQEIRTSMLEKLRTN